MNNRRAQNRIPLKIKVKIKSEEKNTSFDALFDTKDLSVNGTFIETEVSISVGKIIQLQLYFPQINKTFTLNGKVLYAISKNVLTQEQKLLPGFGVQFIDLKNADIQRLTNLIPKTDISIFVTNYFSKNPDLTEKIDYYETINILNEWESNKNNGENK